MLLMIMFMYIIKSNESSLMLKSKGITGLAWHVSIHVFYKVVYATASGVAYTKNWAHLIEITCW